MTATYNDSDDSNKQQKPRLTNDLQVDHQYLKNKNIYEALSLVNVKKQCYVSLVQIGERHDLFRQQKKRLNVQFAGSSDVELTDTIREKISDLLAEQVKCQKDLKDLEGGRPKLQPLLIREGPESTDNMTNTVVPSNNTDPEKEKMWQSLI